MLCACHIASQCDDACVVPAAVALSAMPKMTGRDKKQKELIAGLEDVFFKERMLSDACLATHA